MKIVQDGVTRHDAAVWRVERCQADFEVAQNGEHILLRAALGPGADFPKCE